jgi:hypothetical protein
MISDERVKDIRAVCDCLRYVREDVDKANLPIVSLHVRLAISEAETALDHLLSEGRTAEGKGRSREQAAGQGY